MTVTLFPPKDELKQYLQVITRDSMPFGDFWSPDLFKKTLAVKRNTCYRANAVICANCIDIYYAVCTNRKEVRRNKSRLL